MTSVCPSGHDSASDDYCDVCGLPIPADAVAPSPPAVEEPSQQAPRDALDPSSCPNCQSATPPNALFCEACGYDFTTGALPRPVAPIENVLDLGSPSTPAPTPAPTPVPAPVPTPTPVAPALATAWVAEVWIDPDWYADQESDDPLPSAGVPIVVPLRTTSVLVGRTSRSRGIHPDIDLATDNGISRRHCQLTTDGSRWWVEDLGSSNGTYVASATAALPQDPIPGGAKRELGPDDRVYLGAWTCIAIRRAQPGEV